MEQKQELCIGVPEMAKRMGISRARAYELANSRDFPTVRIGKRMVVPTDALKRWIDERAGQENEARE